MRTPLLHLAVIATLVTVPAWSAGVEAPLLTWTSVKGTTIRARFVQKGEDELVLERENGRRITIKLDLISAASLRMADEQARLRGNRGIAPLRAMEFVKIRHGRFTMGSPLKEPGRLAVVQVNTNTVPDPGADPAADVEPEHEVNISRDFWLKQTEVTWEEWNAVRNYAMDYGYSDISAGLNGSGGDDSGTHPVTGITWWDAVKWCNLKSQIEGKIPAYYITPTFGPGDLLTSGIPVPYVRWDATGYRLPTEAEWEYACRGGRNDNSRAFYSGQISETGVEPQDASLAKIAWYGGNSGGTTHPVATREANNHGLHDMHGNAAEWCWDWEGLLSPKDAEDPLGAVSGRYRVFRGGNWADPAICCRAAYRGSFSPIMPSSDLVGFRPACGSDPAVPDKPDRK